MSFATHFTQLTELLDAFAPYWRVSAYYTQALPWRKHNPALADAVLSLNDEEFASLDNDSTALYGFLARYLPRFEDLVALLDLPSEPINTGLNAHLNPRLNVEVPGRKWQQIESFIGALPPASDVPGNTVVDWCCGKSYLGVLSLITGKGVYTEWRCKPAYVKAASLPPKLLLPS